MLAELIKSQPKNVEEIYIDEESTNYDDEDFLNNARKTNIVIKKVSLTTLDGYIGHRRHQGLVAKVMPPVYQDLKIWLKTLDFSINPAVMVLAEIEDQNNFGAIIRTATAAGVSGIIVPNHNQAEITAATYKTSAGNLGKVPLIQVPNINQTLTALKDAGFWSLALAGEAKQSIYDVQMADSPMVFVVGNEGNGVAQKTKEACDFLASLPMRNQVESLNASVSVAVVLYEWVRQRMIQ